MKNILVKLIDKLLGLFTSTDEFDFKNHVYKEYYKNGKLKRENHMFEVKNMVLKKNIMKVVNYCTKPHIKKVKDMAL